MTPISIAAMRDYYTPIGSGDEVVQADWCYGYDLEFNDSPSNPDMRVLPEWVGKKAKDCCVAWEYFEKPIPNYSI